MQTNIAHATVLHQAYSTQYERLKDGRLKLKFSPLNNESGRFSSPDVYATKEAKDGTKERVMTAKSGPRPYWEKHFMFHGLSVTYRKVADGEHAMTQQAFDAWAEMCFARLILRCDVIKKID